MEECPSEHKEELRKVLELTQANKILTHPLTHKEFQTVSMRALNFIPNMVMLPHFNEAIHATEEHLKASVKRYSRYRHFRSPQRRCYFPYFSAR